ncbi:integrase [Vibrio breoganii]|nr:integrase [Vibrio breoganii]
MEERCCLKTLTQQGIKAIKPASSTRYYWDDSRTKGTGRLGVKVYKSGSKVFCFRYYAEGKPRFITVGRFPDVSLSLARDKARGFSGLLGDGVDPQQHIEDKKSQQKRLVQEEARKGTLEQLFHSYTHQMKKDGKRTYSAVLHALEKEVYPYLSKATKAKDATKDDFILVLSSMIRRGAVTQSNRVRSYLMAAFNYGLAHDNDPANYIGEAKFGLSINPITMIPKQKSGERVGDNYLSLSEVKILIEDLQSNFEDFKMGLSIRNLLQLCFHTGGQRPYELISSKWSEVDWDKRTLNIVPDLSKNKRHHLIPLTRSALTILESQKMLSQDSEFIFPHRFKSDAMRTDSLSQSLARYRGSNEQVHDFVARDIRRTCKTLMGEAGISKDIRDRLQNHALNDVSSKHYDRYEYLSEKRQALEIWERKICDSAISNVITFAKKSS